MDGWLDKNDRFVQERSSPEGLGEYLYDVPLETTRVGWRLLLGRPGVRYTGLYSVAGSGLCYSKLAQSPKVGR